MKKNYYLDDTERDDSDVIADGQSVRVRLDLADSDSLQREVARHFAATKARITDSLGGTSRMNQPGYRFAPSSSLHDSASDARDAAYDALVQRSSNRWRQPMADVAPEVLKAHAAGLHKLASSLEGELDNDEENSNEEAATRGATFQKKWTAAFETEDADRAAAIDARDAAYAELERRSANAWRSSWRAVR
jgi:hypothetical protein